VLPWLALVLACSPVSFGQLIGKGFTQPGVLNYSPPRKVVAKPGEAVDSALPVELRPGYHVNSNTPSDDYLIPLRLTWDPGPLEATSFTFPKPLMEKYKFSEKPLSVFTGDFQIVTRFKAAAKAAPGPATLTGKLRYQACNDSMCLPPKTLDVSLQVEIVK
jgi:thioredoxin:protein disulfide reductase